jgi:hypothetical protein
MPTLPLLLYKTAMLGDFDINYIARFLSNISVSVLVNMLLNWGKLKIVFIFALLYYFSKIIIGPKSTYLNDTIPQNF